VGKLRENNQKKKIEGRAIWGNEQQGGNFWNINYQKSSLSRSKFEMVPFCINEEKYNSVLTEKKNKPEV
jgi:hypothetical protein